MNNNRATVFLGQMPFIKVCPLLYARESNTAGRYDPTAASYIAGGVV